MSNNGSKPIPFAPPPPQIPIVGQPFKLEGWFFQILLTCKCEQPEPVLVIGPPGSAMGLCKGCQKIYILRSFTLSANGQPQFNFEMGHAAPAPPSGTGV